jgi:hypothetical protein
MNTSSAARQFVTQLRLAAGLIVLLPIVAAAQEPVKSFDQLNTRLKIGDTVYVTDAQGREVKSKIQTLAPDAITLKGDGPMTFSARDVSLIRKREFEPLRNGALIGLGVGGGFGVAVCVSIMVYDDATLGWCALALGVYAGVGTTIGVIIDALIPGNKLVAYRAPGTPGTPGTPGSSQPRLSIAPVITTRTKGVAVSYSF